MESYLGASPAGFVWAPSLGSIQVEAQLGPSLAVVLAVTWGTSVLFHLQEARLASFIAAGFSCGLGLRALTMPLHHLLLVTRTDHIPGEEGERDFPLDRRNCKEGLAVFPLT